MGFRENVVLRILFKAFMDWDLFLIYAEKRANCAINDCVIV